MEGPQNIDLLVVDDEDEFRGAMVRRFQARGFRVQEAASGEQALDLASRREFDVAVFDMMMPGMSGLDLLEKFEVVHPGCEVILLTGQGTIEAAVKAMKLGAYDFLTKPFPLKDLETHIEKAFDRRALCKENQQLKALLQRREPQSEMIGESPAMKEVFRLIERAGPSEKPILIQGESGTGKELVARALHQSSNRLGKPMVVINCAALPETLLESELFGHEKGSFTGAVAAKPGLFEVADGSTLFIDEIGEMPGSLQAKLLRVLEDGSLRRVGSIKERSVNVRLLAATNRDLSKEVQCRAVVDALKALALPCVLIELDDRRVQRARRDGVAVIYGDASHAVVLEAAGLARACTLLVTVPTYSDVRAIVQAARRIRPGLSIVARADGPDAVRDLYALGIEDVTAPELEAAIEMTREALVHLARPADEIQRVTTTMRREGYRA